MDDVVVVVVVVESHRKIDDCREAGERGSKDSSVLADMYESIILRYSMMIILCTKQGLYLLSFVMPLS